MSQIVRKAGVIVEGNLALLADSIKTNLFRIPNNPYHAAEVRKRICRACIESTWLTDGEYFGWIKDHGIEVLRNLDDLTALEPLPKRDYTKSKRLFCRLCKCWLPAKAAVKTEQCPLDKWPVTLADKLQYE